MALFGILGGHFGAAGLHGIQRLLAYQEVTMEDEVLWNTKQILWYSQRLLEYQTACTEYQDAFYGIAVSFLEDHEAFMEYQESL